MLQLGFGEALVIVDSAITNKLYLGNTRNGFKVRVKNGLVGVFRLVVAVAITFRVGIKCLGQGILFFGRYNDVAE